MTIQSGRFHGKAIHVLVLLAASVPGCGGKKPSSNEGGSGTLPPLACKTSLAGSAGTMSVVQAGAADSTTECLSPKVSPRCKEGYCRLESGCFIMGEPRDEYEVARYATVQVQVTLTRPFWMSQTEVTREQWESVGWKQPQQFSSTATAECSELNCPQGNVSFYDVVAFTNRYSEVRGLAPCYELSGCAGEAGTGLRCTGVLFANDSIYDCEGYRLPTEAEWEYAARAGTRTAFYAGDVTPQSDPDCHPDPTLESIGWYCYNSRGRVHEVAQKDPNCWGLFDMSGNVSEWCNDLMDPAGYGDGPLIDPVGTRTRDRDITASAEYPTRIKRGGYFSYYAWAAKSGWRSSDDDYQFDSGMGFRLVRTAQPSEM